MAHSTPDNQDWIRKFRENSADMTTLDLLRELTAAVRGGNVERVAFLEENGADLHTNDDAMLCLAAQAQQLEMLRFLVEERGANPNARGGKPLDFAVQEGRTEAVAYLIERGADIHAGKDAALYWAMAQDNAAMTELLLYHGGDVCADNGAPLRRAVVENRENAFKALLDYNGIDAGGEDGLREKLNALRAIMLSGAENETELLGGQLEAWRGEQEKADLETFNARFGDAYSLSDLRETVDENGRTGLMLAARTGRFAEIVKNASTDGRELTAADLSATDDTGTNILETLGRRRQLDQALNPDFWSGRQAELQDVLPHIRDLYHDQVDTGLLMEKLNTGSARDRIRGGGFKKLGPSS